MVDRWDCPPLSTARPTDTGSMVYYSDYEHLEKAFARWKAQSKEDEKAIDQALRERDLYHDVADDITDHVAKLLGLDFGEHSSANNPWTECMEALENALNLKSQSTSAGESGG